jgi:ribosome-associated toxin RatA of RatAB toxin-antitoxin module
VPHTRASILIPLPIRTVYESSKDVKALERFLPEVERIVVLEDTPSHTVSRFEWKVMGKRIVQTQEEDWDDATYGNHFRQTKGDFDVWEGRYLYREVPGGTEFTIDLEWELSLPLIGPLLGRLIGKIVDSNVDALLKGMRDMCLERAGQTA